MKQKYKDAFSEVNEILKLMPTELSNKIPQKFKEIIKNEKSSTYISNIKAPIDECVLKDETVIILALIYRDFLCNELERKNLKARDLEALKAFEEESRKKYNPDNIFKNNKKNNYNSTAEVAITLVKEKWYKKIFNIIRKIFST